MIVYVALLVAVLASGDVAITVSREPHTTRAECDAKNDAAEALINSGRVEPMQTYKFLCVEVTLPDETSKQ